MRKLFAAFGLLAAFLLASCGDPGMLVSESNFQTAVSTATKSATLVATDCNNNKISTNINPDVRSALEAEIARLHINLASPGRYDVESTYCGKRINVTLPVIDNDGAMGTMAALLNSGSWIVGCKIDVGLFVRLYGSSNDSRSITTFFRDQRSCPEDFASGDVYK